MTVKSVLINLNSVGKERGAWWSQRGGRSQQRQRRQREQRGRQYIRRHQIIQKVTSDRLMSREFEAGALGGDWLHSPQVNEPVLPLWL